MAIDRAVVPLLMKEAKERPFSGKVLQLGKLDINFNKDYLADQTL